jgi:preprotein translocase SecE subunit
MNTIANYFRDAVQELNHVRWPTRQQAIKLSIIVLGFTLASSAAFGVVDFLLSRVVKIMLSLLF